jgi:hypothetical protein
MIALTIATSAPDHTQTLDPSMSNSIECGRASPVLFSPTPGDCATLGASTTTDAKAGVANPPQSYGEPADAKRTIAAALARGGVRRG